MFAPEFSNTILSLQSKKIRSINWLRISQRRIFSKVNPWFNCDWLIKRILNHWSPWSLTFPKRMPRSKLCRESSNRWRSISKVKIINSTIHSKLWSLSWTQRLSNMIIGKRWCVEIFMERKDALEENSATSCIFKDLKTRKFRNTFKISIEMIVSVRTCLKRWKRCILNKLIILRKWVQVSLKWVSSLKIGIIVSPNRLIKLWCLE